MNEYGFPAQPKYDHLKNLHLLLREYEELLLHVQPKHINAGWGKEIHIFRDDLIVFSNYRDKNSGIFKFGQKSYIVPKWTVEFYKKKAEGELELLYSTSRIKIPSILKRRVPEETDLRYTFNSSDISWIAESIGSWDSTVSNINPVQEQLSITKDKTDYLWYSLKNVSLEISNAQQIVLNLKSVTDVWYLWIDNVLMFPPAISVSAALNAPQEISGKYFFILIKGFLSSDSFPFKNKQSHNVTILSVVMGLKNYGPWYDSIKKGLFNSMVYLNGIEISKNNWVHQAGMRGEFLQYYRPDKNISWNTLDLPSYASLVWYKIKIPYQKIADLLVRANVDQNSLPFISFALNMGQMGKGHIWVNGYAIGRYWDITSNSVCNDCNYAGGFSAHKCLTNCGERSQTYYHVPYDWLVKSNGSAMQDANIVVFEEKGGNPNQIELVMLV